MKIKSYLCIILLLCSLYSIAQQKPLYRFDFGDGNAAAGYTPVSPTTVYSAAQGYGFLQTAGLTAVRRNNSKKITADFITAGIPFFFSVKLPDGNYDVKLVLGDVKGTSATTIRTECRRLMLQNILTKKGTTSTLSFSVHIRDSLIRNADGTVAGKVRLKPREISYLHWDNQLTIEFCDTMPKVCAVEIYANKKVPTIFLAGNSTVVDQDREPWAAWGQMFPSFFEAGKVVVANYAESGETLKAFKREKRLGKIWSLAKPGDYLFIEFTHNDQKPGGNHLDPFTTYKATLKEWIDEARKRKITPVLVTSMHRRSFDSAGHIINTLLEYPEAMRQTGVEENVTVLDLNAMSKIMYEAWGPVNSVKAFVHYPANTFPGQEKELKDDTHFNPYGAYELARCIVQAIKGTDLPIRDLLKKNIPAFDPAHPDPLTQWFWPQSILMASAKPDGN